MPRVQIKVSIDLETKRLLDRKAKARKVSLGALVEELARWDDRFSRPGVPGQPIGLELADDEVSRPTPSPVQKAASLRRDPFEPGAPRWVRYAADLALSTGMLRPEQDADLRRWMAGEDLDEPGWWKNRPATSLAEAIERPEAPIQGHPPAAFGDVPDDTKAPSPEPTFVPSPPSLPVDLTAGMGDEPVLSKMDEPGYEFPKAYVPPPVIREWTDPGAPAWVTKVGQALYDGDPAADGEPTKALARWRRGEDVDAPEGWSK